MARRCGWLSLAVTMVVVAFYACGRRPVASRTVGAEGRALRVLIATRNTPFKNQLVTQLTEAVSKENATVDVINAENIERADRTRYRVIVILDDYRWWSLAKPVKRFLAGLDASDQKKVIVIGTAGSPKKMRPVSGVDAITCASKLPEMPALAERLVAKVKQRLVP